VRRERGIAAVTAVLVVAVAASAAALMLAQQSAMLDQTLLVASRAQADLYARAGVDWARGVVYDSSRNSYQALSQGWAQPIAALPVERALVAGAITDEQSKFNLNNLRAKGPADIKAFQQLLASLALAPELADAVIDWVDDDSDLTSTAGAEDSYYLSLAKPYRAANREMVQVEELYRIRGFDAASVAKLRPYVTALPGPTKVNANTASDVLLNAMLPGSTAKVAKFLSERRAKPLVSSDTVGEWAGTDAKTTLDVKSTFFSVRINVAQDEVELSTDALLQSAQGAPPVILWSRPRY
jgi:general secretion pathway protein K